MEPFPMSEEWLERYSRQILLKEIGGQGQQQLGQSVVGIIGAGHMGTPLLLYLAAAGVGHLLIVDDDRKNPGWATAAHPAVHALNPLVKVTTLGNGLHADHVSEQILSWDLMVLADSHPDTQQTLNAAALRTGKPLLSGWRSNETHYITACRIDNAPQTPCLSCLTSTQKELSITTDSKPDADAALTAMGDGVAGSILAMETLKTLLDIGQGLWSNLLMFSPGAGTYTMIPTQRHPLCHACNGNEHV